MPTFLMLTKKPAALPLLKGTPEGWNHLDPVEIVTSDASIRNLAHVNYIPNLDAAMIRATGAYKHHVWIAISGTVTAAQVNEFFKAPSLLSARGVPVARRVYCMDTAVVSAALRAKLADRDQEAILETPISLATILKVRA